MTCTPIGYGRCAWSVPVPDLGYTPPDGYKDGYICSRRRYDINTPALDGSGHITGMSHSLGTPSGLARFEPLCRQYGCCDQYKAAEDRDTDTAPFSMRDLRVIQELWGAADQRLYRLIPRTGSFAAWQAQRIAHKSILWHCGYIGLATPNGVDHGLSVFRGAGLWGTNYYTYTDKDGNTRLDLVQGGMDGRMWDSVAEGSEMANSLIDCDGHIAATGTDYKTKRDPVTPGGTVIERELERIGVAVEKDSGELQYHSGLAESSVAVAAQNIEFAAGNLDSEDTQRRAGGTFKRTAGAGAVITLQALRQAAKSEYSLGTRTLHAASVDGDAVKLEFTNGQHIFSLINDGPEIGHSYDQKFVWEGGGAWPILPKESQRVDSYYEPNKYAGSRAFGAWSGDAVRVNGRTFVIKKADAFAGSEAAGWGDNRYVKYGYTVPVIWRPSDLTLALGTDPETYGAWAITAVTDTGTSTALTLVESETRPALAAGEYWYSTDGLFIGAAGNYDVAYTVEKPKDEGTAGTHTEYVTVPALVEMQTQIPVSEWNGADTQAVLVDGNAPATGYTVDTSGTYVKLSFALSDAARVADITLTYAGQPADTYQFGWMPGYEAYGKKRDCAWVFDDPDGFAAALTAGATVEFLKVAAVSMPGWTLEYRVSGGAWTAVTAEIYAGDGTATVAESWFADKAGKVDFRCVGVKLMDHRGICPASLLNKTFAAVRALQWVRSGLGPGLEAYTYSKAIESMAEVNSSGDILPGSTTEYEPGGTGNYVQVWSGFFTPPTPPYPGGDASWGIAVNIISTSFNLGNPIANWTIIEARAEMSASTITRTSSWSKLGTYPCGGGGREQDGESTTTVENISYAFIGIDHTGGSFEVLATVPGAGEKISVVNVTEIMQIMYAHQSDGMYGSFGFILIPAGMDSLGDLNSVMPSMPGVETVPVCEGGVEHYYTGWTDGYAETLTWGNITMSNIIMKVQYPEEEFTRQIIIPQMPAMV